jgi:hypothetical protein
MKRTGWQAPLFSSIAASFTLGILLMNGAFIFGVLRHDGIHGLYRDFIIFLPALFLLATFIVYITLAQHLTVVMSIFSSLGLILLNVLCYFLEWAAMLSRV